MAHGTMNGTWALQVQIPTVTYELCGHAQVTSHYATAALFVKQA